MSDQDGVHEITSEQQYSDDERDKLLETRHVTFVQAVNESDAACAWIKNYCLKQDVANLGKKIREEYRNTFNECDDPNDAARMAIRWLWIAEKHSQLMWQEWIATGFVKDNDFTRELETKLEVGYDGDLGWAFSDHLGNNEYSDALKKFGEYSNETLLSGIAMVWFCKADDLIAAGKIMEALDVIADAFSALEKVGGLCMWNGAKECATEEKIERARNAAIARHSPTYEKRDQVIKYWRENIAPDKSNEFAAELLNQFFPEISHRTLVSYVARAKKLQSASTP